jgi:hypothetical protein
MSSPYLHSFLVLSLAFQLQALCCCLRTLLLDNLLAPLPFHALHLWRQPRVTLGPVRPRGLDRERLVSCVLALRFNVAAVSRLPACEGG